MVAATFLSVFFYIVVIFFSLTVSRIEKQVFFIGRRLAVLQNGIGGKALKRLYKKPVFGLNVIQIEKLINITGIKCEVL